MTALLWFRNDLRLDDHEALHDLCARHHDQVIPVYCVDPRHFEETELGYRKTGAFRARFLLEALHDLRERLRDLGADLVVRHGKPEVELIELAQATGATEVGFFEEVTTEEMEVEEGVRQAFETSSLHATGYWGATLYHVGDVPFYIEDLPDVFTHFRKKVEKGASIRSLFDEPATLASLPQGCDPGSLPTLAELGFHDELEADDRGVLDFVGGESAALARIEHYFFEADELRRYKETRNGLIGANYSSKLSPWLALGCVSPRRVFVEVKRYERERVSNSSTYWMIFELIWRDYFRFLAMREGAQLFKLAGVQHTSYRWRRDRAQFERWVRGETGVPFVDANMRELAQTGFMSNRGRQNVASYLAKELEIDWRWGASYFESMLLDYDPCSNWGNWQYVSGVGNDPRDRKFNVVKQGERYDPDGKYIRRWLPELEALSKGAVHAPWSYGDRELKRRFDVQLGVDYPRPLTAMGAREQQLRFV